MPILAPTTWNPADKGGNCTLSGGNLTAQSNDSSLVRSVFGAASGKWYWEVMIVGRASGAMIGVGTAAEGVGRYVGETAQSWSYYGYNPPYKYHAGAGNAYGGALGAQVGAVVGVALDMDAGTLQFFLDGADLGVAYTGLSGVMYAMFSGASPSAYETITANFGATGFAYSPPAGFQAGFGVKHVLGGLVEDGAGAPASRLVVAFNEATFDEAGRATSNAATGAYQILVDGAAAHTLVAYPPAGSDLPALVLSGVVSA